MGTTWPSLRKAFTRHGLGMPARNPDAICQLIGVVIEPFCGTVGLEDVALGYLLLLVVAAAVVVGRPG